MELLDRFAAMLIVAPKNSFRNHTIRLPLYELLHQLLSLRLLLKKPTSYTTSHKSSLALEVHKILCRCNPAGGKSNSTNFRFMET